MTGESTDIRLNCVSFAYDEQPVLDGVSAVIPRGKVTALIGPNGSGKATLLKLIDRLYPAESGEVLLGEERASDISLKSWREQFAVVPQRPALFAGSIRSNICYGTEREVSEEELARVVHLANLDGVTASHEGGLDYEVGINGTGLSGGEQQRILQAASVGTLINGHGCEGWTLHSISTGFFSRSLPVRSGELSVDGALLMTQDL